MLSSRCSADSKDTSVKEVALFTVEGHKDLAVALGQALRSGERNGAVFKGGLQHYLLTLRALRRLKSVENSQKSIC